MMGHAQPQKELFSYRIDLDQRVRPDHPLRAIKAAVDFTFVRAEVAACYGYNGNESVPPEVILKLMFLLFYDNVASERELMRMLSLPTSSRHRRCPRRDHGRGDHAR